MNDINVGGEAAIMGGVHSDSHDVHNTTNTTNHVNTTTTTTTNNVVNNSTVYQAQRTDAEFKLDNENQFLKAVQERFADGRLDQKELAELSQLCIQWNVPQERANEIINQVRTSINILMGDQGNDYLVNQMLQEVFNAVQSNAAEVLRHKMNAFERLVANSQNADVHYYYNLLLSSFTPEVAVLNFMKSHADDYWQLYWTHIAHIKIGNTDNALALLPRLGGFGAPQGDIALLMAIDNLADYKMHKGQTYYLNQAEQYLQQALQGGMSQQLSPLWYAINDLVKGNTHIEDWYTFYYKETLKEFLPEPPKSLNKSAAMPQPQMPPPMPKFNAQNVNLAQMQGFNPLQAANQLGMGRMQSMAGTPMATTPPPMPQMPPQMPQEPNKAIPITEAVQIATEMRQAEGTIDVPDPLEPHHGMILTNSLVLANKYNCTQQEVYDVFNNFIQTAYDKQMYWHFADIATAVPVKTWENINAFVSQQMQSLQAKASADYHLFIVGGDDVIPIPRIIDPYENGGDKIPADMCYCFEGNLIESMIEEQDFYLDVSEARNNVARLPLENGILSTKITEDLASYFNLSSLYAGGIPVGNVVMSSNRDWVPASATMTEHLPLLYSAEDPELVKNGMYISPKLITSNNDVMEIYARSLKKADMLMFNLHGADLHSHPGFYSTDEAFSPACLQNSNARVFNTVACFGARFINYKRNESMLLSALYGGGVLLYTGSLVPVPMYYHPELNEARELLLNPGTGSEVFMRLYPLYQFKGMTAGKALLRAKCDYFNMCRHVENDGFSLSTALMFSLYGNPMLHVRKRKHVIEAALQNDAMPPAPIKAYKQPLRKTLINRVVTQNQSQSLLEQVRGYVDENLAAIRSMAEQYIYNQLGLPPRDLDSIDQFSRPTIDGNYELGYLFHYRNKTAKYAADSHVELDKAGNIKRVYTVK